MFIIPILVYYYALINSGNVTPAILKDYVVVEAIASGVDTQLAIRIAGNESRFNPHPKDGDGDKICKTTGEPMRSRGMWQWNTCGHPDISDEQAYNPIISTQLAIQAIKRGECYMWTTSGCHAP